MVQLEEDKSLKYFVLFGNQETIQDVILKAHKRNLLFRPRQWMIIMTDRIAGKEFKKKVGKVLAVTNTAVAQRQPSKKKTCHLMAEGCQLKIVFETFGDALKAVIDLPHYDFAHTNPIKGQTKNRLIAEIKVNF